MYAKLIERCGMHSSKIAHPHEKKTVKRTVTGFEFEYILAADTTCTAFLDTEEIKLLPSSILVRKPGQVSNTFLHFKAYYIHTTINENSPLYKDLISLPSYYIFINTHTYERVFKQLIQHNIACENNEADYYTQSKLLELLYHLKKDARQNTNVQNTFLVERTNTLQQAIAFMKKNFYKKITLSMLAELVGYSPNHFQKIFMDLMNISPQKYLETIRINHAKYLLSQNELSIADIAYACGFSSQAYFSLIFKQATNLSPKEFQKNELVKYML